MQNQQRTPMPMPMQQFKPKVTQFRHFNDQQRFGDDQWADQTRFNDWSQPGQFDFQNYDNVNPTQMSDVDRLTRQQFDMSRSRFQPQFDRQNTDTNNQLASRGIGMGSTLDSDFRRDVNRNQGDILMGLEQNAFDKAMGWGDMTFQQQLANRQSQMEEDQMQSNYNLGYGQLEANIANQQAQYGLGFDQQGINRSGAMADYNLGFDTMMGNEMARRNQMALSRDQALNQINLSARGQDIGSDQFGRKGLKTCSKILERFS